MTIPPEAKLFRLGPEESPVSAARPMAAGAPRPVAAPQPGGPRIEVARGPRPVTAEAADPRLPGKNTDVPPGMTAGEFLMSDTGADDGLPDPRKVEAAAEAAPGDGPVTEAERDAVRAEGIRLRQLRIAQRIAASNGIDVDSGEDAVVLLRRQGIDPFQRAGLRKAVAAEGARDAARPVAGATAVVAKVTPARVPAKVVQPGTPAVRTPAGLPATATPPSLPAREEMTEARRAAEILRIQRDIARRRRRRLMWLFARLSAFVFLPTILAGWYFFTQATPTYATYSQFLIQRADSLGGGSGGGGGGMMAAAAGLTDAIAVQSYLTSRDAMLRLDQEEGFKQAFQDPSVDPLLRLPADATDEATYKLYKKSVLIGYDPTEGMIKMEVIAPDPKMSERFSLALLRFAEGQVDQMTARVREDQMTGAQKSYENAEKAVKEAQTALQDLQGRLGSFDPKAESGMVLGQIGSLETQAVKKRLELAQLQSNVRPNATRVAGVKSEIELLEREMARLRAQLTEATSSSESLAVMTGQMRMAEADLQTRQSLLSAAAEAVDAARIEANKQVRYLSLSVAPVPPDAPTYPRKIQNTIMTLLIMSGVYLMLSLTASILREQVSS